MVAVDATRDRLEGDRRHIGRMLCILLTTLLVLVAIVSLGYGASGVSAPRVLADWLAGRDIAVTDRVVMIDIRLPRLLTGILVGASLAVSGAVMQGLFRNPLADPGLLGVSAGASLGAISGIVLGGLLPAAILGLVGWYLVPLAAFGGGWIAMLTLYGISTRRGRTSVATMLLAGIALGAMVGALSGLIVYYANDAQLRDLTFWGMGSLAGASWTKLSAAAPLIVTALIAAPFLARGLNGLALGEAAAAHVGIRVQRVKRVAILTAAAAVGASVAITGGIGFVGIVVPHLLRLLTGPDHRWLLVNSGLLGATVLLCADMVSRTVIAPAELPIGIITAMIGGPFFMWVLLSNRRVIDL
ncbi:iron complex transport system permease protein [Paracoccus alcaliphilus]|uniref:Iron complex transport system permease protein n=1 Tax=Paracoccus alcaliphilus TaxID=34002 RepID=A0A1H8HS22_9RHOB|nr:iron ABC transporter permease [Paracoccus alcaliphilus]WCR19044.1 iron ABC transporter permease [Paracoccus alcaliphilus]SEN58869.1 iron complex transport system permease protein [Paracoccus alcaliphilus]